MVRLLLGISDGEERSTRSSLGLFIPVTAGTSSSEGGQFIVMMEVSRVLLRPIIIRVLIYSFTRFSLSNIGLRISLPFLFWSVAFLRELPNK
jgi:hypothetical protein